MKDFTAKIVKLENGNEALRFTIGSGKKDVALTSQGGINGLKAVYEALLAEVMDDDVTVKLEESDKGTTAMYQDVCKEFIKLLNSDLKSARTEIVSKGL